MIIKKKYTTINVQKTVQQEQIQEIPAVDFPENAQPENTAEEKIAETSEEQNDITEENVPAPKKEAKKKKSMDDLDLTLDNIKFEPREERREGTRRRGYRRTQDRNIVSRAQKDAEVIRESAKKDGYNAGIEAAEKDLQELRGKLAEFLNIKNEVFDKVSEGIMDISVEIAKKIINKTVETDREYIIPMIRGVVEEVNRTENKIVLRVMPKDAEIVKDNISEIFSENNTEAAISVVPDKEIKEGGVIIETSNGIIDASIETQLAIVEKAFKKKEES